MSKSSLIHIHVRARSCNNFNHISVLYRVHSLVSFYVHSKHIFSLCLFKHMLFRRKGLGVASFPSVIESANRQIHWIANSSNNLSKPY